MDNELKAGGHGRHLLVLRKTTKHLSENNYVLAGFWSPHEGKSEVLLH
jgi:hypothetical protein